MKKFLSTALLLLCCFALVLSIGCGNNGDAPATGDKASAKIILVLEDGTELNYDITFTAGSTLRMALYEGGLIEEDQTAAMFVETIDGHTADVLNDGCTWLPCDENKEQIVGSFDEIIVEDGQTLYLQYYVVPYMD